VAVAVVLLPILEKAVLVVREVEVLEEVPHRQLRVGLELLTPGVEVGVVEVLLQPEAQAVLVSLSFVYLIPEQQHSQAV